MWLEGGLDNIICDNSTTIVQVKVFTETAVGAHHRETHFKAIDFAKKGDGQFSNIQKKERISNLDFTWLKHWPLGIGGQIRDTWEAASEDELSPVVTIRIADFVNNVVATRRQIDNMVDTIDLSLHVTHSSSKRLSKAIKDSRDMGRGTSASSDYET